MVINQAGSISLRISWDAAEEDPMDQLLGHSITYRIAVGLQAGRKVFTLQTLPARKSGDSIPIWGRP